MHCTRRIGLRQVSTIYTSDNQYSVILEVEPEYQLDANAMGSLYVRSKTGQLVPLRAVAKLDNTLGPLRWTTLARFLRSRFPSI